MRCSSGRLVSGLGLCCGLGFLVGLVITMVLTQEKRSVSSSPASTETRPAEKAENPEALRPALEKHLYSSGAISYFPDCGLKQQPASIHDFTALLKQHNELKGACISNPSIVRLDELGHFLASFRIYRSSVAGRECTSGGRPGGQWNEGWRGSGGLGLLVFKWTGPAEIELLVQQHEMPSSREDARLFRDDAGKIRLLYNRWRGGDEALRGFKRNQRRSMHVSEIVVSPEFDSLQALNEQELIYINQQLDEKNWVPWEAVFGGYASRLAGDPNPHYSYELGAYLECCSLDGSVFMTYPQYPGFEPHIVIEWNAYDEPQDSLEFKAITPVPFMKGFRDRTGGWIRFSGGTPGIRLDADRFIAVGHTVGDLSCFHRRRPPRLGRKQQGGNWWNKWRSSDARSAMRADASSLVPAASRGNHRHLLSDGPRDLKEDDGVDLAPHACNSSYPAPHDHWAWAQHFEGMGHKLPGHHPYWEYLFFMYTWSATYPYEITHISHAFIPYDIQEHHGVYFPTGLERLPATWKAMQQPSGAAAGSPGSAGKAKESSSGNLSGGLVLTYGKDDNQFVAMTLSQELLQEWLVPVGSLATEDYKFCTIGRQSPRYTVGGARS